MGVAVRVAVRLGVRVPEPVRLAVRVAVAEALSVRVPEAVGLADRVVVPCNSNGWVDPTGGGGGLGLKPWAAVWQNGLSF